MTKRRMILAADLFCGAGGTSEGLLMAANEMNADLTLVAINHWQVAIDTHSINHPYAKHLCTGLEAVKPRDLVPGGRLNVLCASPECTHHSVARGGRPMNDQSRSSAWYILHWAESLYIDSIIVENVPEFQSWGPLAANGRPMKSKRGHLFQQFIASLRALGYNVEWKVLNCADYGDPTTRQRLFVIARRGGKPIRWPEPTHMPASKLGGLFAETRKPWRTAREIIDWSIPSRSIFERKKPLADNTIRRIQAGIRKFWGVDIDLHKCMADNLRPFIVVFRNNQDAVSLDGPLPTLTTGGANFGLVEPFLIPQHGGGEPRDVSKPIPTVATKGAISLVSPLLMQIDQASGSGCVRGVDSPLPTLVTKENTALVEPFVVTVTHSGAERVRSINDPLPTVTRSMGEGIAIPFLVQYYGSSDVTGIDDPLPTATTKDRFGLIEAKVDRYMIDIHFRMLATRECARGQGFPDAYQFTGKREDVMKQIGNAVPPNTAKALIMEALQ